MSGKILQTIIDDGHIKDDALDDINMKRVQDLIMGSCPEHQAPSNAALPLNDKRFLFDIVANGRNSIDVDKYDYLARDSHYCNVKVSCDLQRLRQLTKVQSPNQQTSNYTHVVLPISSWALLLHCLAVPNPTTTSFPCQYWLKLNETLKLVQNHAWQCTCVCSKHKVHAHDDWTMLAMQTKKALPQPSDPIPRDVVL